jgi:hypothetical protein
MGALTRLRRRSARISLTPPELAARYGVEPAKVLAWIRQGELRAINLATRPTGRPRWIIYEEDVAVFEDRRAAKPPVKPERRSRRATTEEVFFT